MQIDSAVFRQTLGHFPTGVTVITATEPSGEPVGVTIGSFTSVSLEPPLVGFLPMVDSTRWHSIREVGSFCVNVLGADQGDLCWRFARTSVERPFEDVPWRPTAITGSPLLAGAIAWIDCRIHDVVVTGDHHFVLGAVVDMGHADAESDPNPLLFFRGGLGTFEQVA